MSSKFRDDYEKRKKRNSISSGGLPTPDKAAEETTEAKQEAAEQPIIAKKTSTANSKNHGGLPDPGKKAEQTKKENVTIKQVISRNRAAEKEEEERKNAPLPRGYGLEEKYTKSELENIRKQLRKSQFALRLMNGKEFGKVGYNAFMAVAENRLDSYTPENESESKVLDAYKRYMGFGINFNSVNEKYKNDKFGAGNIDLTNLPVISEKDGTKRAADSYKLRENGKVILIPTVAYGDDGTPTRLTKTAAIKRYHNTGENYGAFDTVSEADDYARQLSLEQSAFIEGRAALIEASWEAQGKPEFKDGASAKPEKASIGTRIKDDTIDAFLTGMEQTRRGREIGRAITSGDTEKADKLANQESEDRYNYKNPKGIEKAVRGAMEMAGQIAANTGTKEALGAGLAGAGMAAVAGQAGPQVLAPEEVVTVPGAFLAGVQTASALSNAEVEAGSAYEEMRKQGVPAETAKNIAAVVGGVNGALEFIQLDEIADGAKILFNSGKTEAGHALLKAAAKAGINIASETAQEVAQEGVTIAGSNAGRALSGLDTDSAKEVLSRLGDTAASSAMTFAIPSVAGAAAGGVARAAGKISSENNTADNGGSTETTNLEDYNKAVSNLALKSSEAQAKIENRDSIPPSQSAAQTAPPPEGRGAGDVEAPAAEKPSQATVQTGNVYRSKSNGNTIAVTSVNGDRATVEVKISKVGRL